jgi:hypothetical protein
MKLNNLYKTKKQFQKWFIRIWKIKYYKQTGIIQIFFRNKSPRMIIKPTKNQISYLKQHPRFRTIPIKTIERKYKK